MDGKKTKPKKVETKKAEPTPKLVDLTLTLMPDGAIDVGFIWGGK